MDWLRSEDLKEEKVMTTSNFIIARGQLRRSFSLSYKLTTNLRIPADTSRRQRFAACADKINLSAISVPSRSKHSR